MPFLRLSRPQSIKTCDGGQQPTVGNERKRSMNTRIARWSGVMVAALLAVGVHGALAQPGGGPGHGHGHGGGLAIEQILASLKGQLNLNTSQQLMWDNAVAQTKAARATGRTNFE